MNWLEIDIYNILLGYMTEDKANECVEAIMNRINNPQSMTHIVDCIGEE